MAAKTAEPPAAADKGTATSSETPQLPEIDRETLQALLERHAQSDPEFRAGLRSNRAIAGIAGEIAHTIAQNTLAEERRKADEDKAADREGQRLRLAKEDPEAFAASELEAADKKTRTAEETALRNAAIREFGTSLGKAVSAIPEFKELTPEEHGRIAAALAGKSQAEVLPLYTQMVVDLVADKRAEKRHAERWDKDLKKEVEAAIKERNAKALVASKGPGLKPPSSGRVSDEPKPFTKEWDAWYESKYLGKRAS